MAIVGDKNIFAIEWKVTVKDKNYEYVKFRFWVNGQPLGDYENEVILSSTICYLKIFLNHFLSRTNKLLCGRTKEDIFKYIYDGVMYTTTPEQRLHDSLISSEEEKLEDYSYLGQLRNQFHLDDAGGSSFTDKYNVILFNDGITRSQRMIWRDLNDMSLHEAELPDGFFDKVAKEFLAKTKL